MILSKATKCLALLVAVAAPMSASVALEGGEKFKDWTVGCEKLANSDKQGCFIYQTLIDEKDTPVLQMAVGYLPDNGKPAAILTVPLDVALIPGMGLKVDKGELIRFPYERCVAQGCIAVLPLEAKLIAQFKRGANALVVIHDGRKVVNFPPISLQGFTKGFGSLKP